MRHELEKDHFSDTGTVYDLFEAATSSELPRETASEMAMKAKPARENEVERMIGVFDFESKTVLLNSGYEMPILGLGTYALDHDTCVNSVRTLLANGGRLIDTAYMYGNEDAVGEGVRQAMEEYGISREEIFVITKIYPSQFQDPEAAIDMALEKLDIGYIDMMLLHHPGAGDVKAYKAKVEGGVVKLTKVSDGIVPANTGVILAADTDAGTCWYPLGGRGYTAALLGDDTVRTVADAHGVSAAQVILRWDLQRGIVVIPGSGDPEHIKENLDLFGFELDETEMKMINALDRGEKHDWY